jgi:hypothetical protein
MKKITLTLFAIAIFTMYSQAAPAQAKQSQKINQDSSLAFTEGEEIVPQQQVAASGDVDFVGYFVTEIKGQMEKVLAEYKNKLVEANFSALTCIPTSDKVAASKCKPEDPDICTDGMTMQATVDKAFAEYKKGLENCKSLCDINNLWVNHRTSLKAAKDEVGCVFNRNGIACADPKRTELRALIENWAKYCNGIDNQLETIKACQGKNFMGEVNGQDCSKQSMKTLMQSAFKDAKTAAGYN